MRIAIVLGTSRPTGNTAQLINHFVASTNNPVSVYSLSDYQVLPYDYHFANQDDDFPALISEVIAAHEIIVLATPIYWYAPSAQMKAFMDRLTDLLEINKTLGRQLKGEYTHATSRCLISALSQGLNIKAQLAGMVTPFQ
ncbi:flavodoxin family protein [Thalassotalea euphylliae]|uniref:Flavodoxin family protein n=1 Tax=Thalassotalea euphylliae TaxID=1655234 RepID=A0A3E0TVL5_9GAMM|nr:flavodoxin family protein [Thalassotalea euphylliae]REL28716.1 flavodoxin family protein [Thalassotalea euphylliae]